MGSADTSGGSIPEPEHRSLDESASPHIVLRIESSYYCVFPYSRKKNIPTTITPFRSIYGRKQLYDLQKKTRVARPKQPGAAENKAQNPTSYSSGTMRAFRLAHNA